MCIRDRLLPHGCPACCNGHRHFGQVKCDHIGISLDLLRRFSKRVVLAFDADEAGAGAAERGFERSVPGDLDLRVAVLPEGRDPADLVAEGMVGDLEAAIDASVPLLQFRIDRELAGFDLSEAESRGRAVRAAAALISLHPDPVVQHEYAAVSYTHLRAHETVLDLVCRLLLEKKK